MYCAKRSEEAGNPDLLLLLLMIMIIMIVIMMIVNVIIDTGLPVSTSSKSSVCCSSS